jgi:KaiC/GvpD/RAD55 family RecA-like ATPase
MAKKKNSKKSKKVKTSHNSTPIILGSDEGSTTAELTNDTKVVTTNPKKEKIKNDPTRSQTGIPGFDGLISGGFPKGSSILVCGGPGTGKSIFCEQFLVNGAKEFNEKGLFISFEQTREAIIEQAKQFGWDLAALEKKGLLTIMAIPVKKITPKIMTEIQSVVKKKKIKRLVVDSLSTLIINAPIYSSSKGMSIQDVMGDNVMFSPQVIGEYITQKFLYNFIDDLRELTDCTSLLIGEADQSGKYISRDTLSEFACDGIVLITFESMGGDYSRSMTIRKMRHTKNDEDVHPMEISNKGIIIHSIE